MIKRGWQIKLNFRYNFQQNVPDVLICFLHLKMDECENCGKCRDIERRLWETGDDGWRHGKRLLVFSTKGEKVDLPNTLEKSCYTQWRKTYHILEEKTATHIGKRCHTPRSVSLPSLSFAGFIPITNIIILIIIQWIIPYLCHNFENLCFILFVFLREKWTDRRRALGWYCFRIKE